MQVYKDYTRSPIPIFLFFTHNAVPSHLLALCEGGYHSYICKKQAKKQKQRQCKSDKDNARLLAWPLYALSCLRTAIPTFLASVLILVLVLRYVVCKIMICIHLDAITDLSPPLEVIVVTDEDSLLDGAGSSYEAIDPAAVNTIAREIYWFNGNGSIIVQSLDGGEPHVSGFVYA